MVSTAIGVLGDALTHKGSVANTEKTVLMIIQPVASVSLDSPPASPAFDNCCSQYNRNDIIRVTKTRLLGVAVDDVDNLFWNEHIGSICLRLGRKVGALRQAFRQLTQAARRQYLLSAIQPDLQFASIAIVPSMSDHNRQRSISLKIWRNNPLCSRIAVFRQHCRGCLVFGTNPLDQRWALQFALTVCRCYSNNAPAELSKKLYRPAHTCGTRNRYT